MSTARKSSLSDSSAKTTQPESGSLRPLAPKIRPIAPRPPSSRSSTTSVPASHRNAQLICSVCFKNDCQLLTHKAFGASIVRHDSVINAQNAASSRGPDPGFTASYAFALAQQYNNKDGAAPRDDPAYNLPVKAALDTPEMHRLFHDFFAIDSQTTFRIARPPEIVGDVVLSPFFVPAMHDSALCLSILATAAAVIPTRSGMPARNVVSLTLIGETMQQMRERIEADPHQISDVTIVAATFLWLVNIWLEDVDATDSHANSVVTFVTTRGGLNSLGMVGAVAQFVRWTDVLSSFTTGQPCRFLDEIMPYPELALTITPRYGSFWSLPHVPLVDPIDSNVSITCQETCKLVDFLELAIKGGISPRQYLYVVQKLCYICTKDTVFHIKLYDAGRFDECIFLAINLIRIKIFCANHHLQHVLAQKGATALANALQRMTHGASFWQTDLDLVIWLLFSLLLSDQAFEGREWSLTLLHQAVTSKFGHPEKWVASWRTDLSQLLCDFGWSDMLLAEDFQRTCHLIAQAHGLILVETEGQL